MKWTKPSVRRFVLYYCTSAVVLGLGFWLTGRGSEIAPLMVVLAILGICSYSLGYALYLSRVDPTRSIRLRRKRDT